MSNGNPPPECPTGSCGYGANAGSGDCDGGDSSCANARLAVPNNTNDYYTAAIKAASIDINDALASLGQGPPEHKLSFLRTPQGVAVGWIRHRPNAPQQPAVPGQVRADDPAVIGALMIDQGFYQGDLSASGKWKHTISNNEVTCTQGNEADCWIASFLVAGPNAPYHPKAVRDVVIYIQGRLQGLSKEAGGRKLALIRTTDGIQLVWAKQLGQAATPTAAG